MRKYIIIFGAFFVLLKILQTNSVFVKKMETLHTNVKYIRSCRENNANLLKLYLNTNKFNRTHLSADMDITLYEDFGQEYKIDLEIRIWKDGGWKRNFIHVVRNNCCESLYILFAKTWYDIIDAAKANRGCPVKPNHYEFKQFFIDVSRVPLIITEGDFYVTANVTKNNVVQCCIEIELDVQKMPVFP